MGLSDLHRTFSWQEPHFSVLETSDDTFFLVPWFGTQFLHQTEGKSRQSRYGEVGCYGDVQTKSGNLIFWMFVETWEPSFAHYFHTKMSTR